MSSAAAPSSSKRKPSPSSDSLDGSRPSKHTRLSNENSQNEVDLTAGDEEMVFCLLEQDEVPKRTAVNIEGQWYSAFQFIAMVLKSGSRATLPISRQPVTVNMVLQAEKLLPTQFRKILALSRTLPWFLILAENIRMKMNALASEAPVVLHKLRMARDCTNVVTGFGLKFLNTLASEVSRVLDRERFQNDKDLLLATIAHGPKDMTKFLGNQVFLESLSILECDSVFGASSTVPEASIRRFGGGLEQSLKKSVRLCADFEDSFVGPMLREAYSILEHDLVQASFSKFKESVLLAQAPDFITSACAKFVKTNLNTGLEFLETLFLTEVEGANGHRFGDPGATGMQELAWRLRFLRQLYTMDIVGSRALRNALFENKLTQAEAPAVHTIE